MVLLDSDAVNKNFELVPFSLDNANGVGKWSSDQLSKDIVLIAFICNHCPYVHRITKDFVDLAEKWKDQVETVCVSSNDPNYNAEDSFPKMIKYAKDHLFGFPYLFDETQEVAKAYGALCTPDLYVFKKVGDKYLQRYRGRLEELDRCYRELSEADDIGFEQIPSAGCSIKWKN